MAENSYPGGSNQPGWTGPQPGDHPGASSYNQPPAYNPQPSDQPYQGGTTSFQGGTSYGAEPVRHRGSGMAIAALVLGIVGLITSFIVVGGVIGLLAVILGVIASKRAKRGKAGGRGKAIAGIITGALGLVIAIVLVAAGATFLNSKPVKDLRTCLNNAGGNQSQIQTCNNQFRSQVGG